MSYQLHPLAMAGAAALWCATLPAAALAQAGYAQVLDATPIYEQVATPHETCMELARHTRCTTSTSYEEHIVGYDVLYEYNGQQFNQRMAQKPGKRIRIQAATTSQRHSSTDRPGTSSVKPGAKSYGSVPPGVADVERIEYHHPDSEFPVFIDIHPRHVPHRP
ncbi:MAG TPA: hypothetical protein VIG85_02355 [Comamonas sp.]|uniref:hypothetical protein n=1 Tax=Comamonas halotolerans TaxID=3041496 RepID=UPI0024E0D4D8|nr:hypothetical protein [Comamonas sp. NoAH]